MPLWHDELGMVGKADVVEFLPDGVPYPVEYKHGSRNKAADIAYCDDIQLAGQALCLEYSLGKPVPEGAIYYASSKRRRVVPISAALREEVVRTTEAIRQMLNSTMLPPVLPAEQAARRCKACSLIDRCQPQATPIGLSRGRSMLFDPDG